MIVVLLVMMWVAKVNGAYVPVACWIFEGIALWITFMGWLNTKKRERDFAEALKKLPVTVISDDRIGDEDDDDGK